MIIDRGKIKIGSGIEYLSDWQAPNGNFMFDQYLTGGRMLVNKVTTGCGFTTYALRNNENAILAAPRTAMLRNKLEQFNEKEWIIFYFNREQTAGKSLDDLGNELLAYKQSCDNQHRPYKLLVTYDSFITLADMLEHRLGCNINDNFRIYVDECHSLIKDVPLKEFNNNTVLTEFLDRLFMYDRLVFISATPIASYIGEIEQFRDNQVDYIELEWSNVMPVTVNRFACKSSINAFDQIYEHYSKNLDYSGRHYFDARYDENGQADYSYEAVIFLNNVKDIAKIIAKYVNKKNQIDVADITVFCANTPNNQNLLHKISKKLNICTSIPKRGETHTTWTFATRTVFEGSDFYSMSASSYVIANYNVKCLSLDPISDILQIIGRQRLKENRFRDKLNVFYTDGTMSLTEDDFKALQQKKEYESNLRINVWSTALPIYKDTVLNDLRRLICQCPYEFYLKTVNGYPEINTLIVISEKFCYDILKNHEKLFIMNHVSGPINYSGPVLQLLHDMSAVSSDRSMHDKMKLVYDCLSSHPECTHEVFLMLNNESYTKVAYYFSKLPLERIKANGFDSWKMDGEIAFKNDDRIKNTIQSEFISGQTYTKKEVKTTLQRIYDDLCLSKTAKATDLQNYIECKECKKGGIKAIKIL